MVIPLFMVSLDGTSFPLSLLTVASLVAVKISSLFLPNFTYIAVGPRNVNVKSCSDYDIALLQIKFTSQL